MPAAIHAMPPALLCDLLDGLEGIPESQYGAWMAEHHPVPPSDGDGDMSLGWLGWSPGMALMLDARNRLEAIRVTLARMCGDRKTQYDRLPPPGTDDTRTQHEIRATADSAKAFFSGM